MYSFEENDLEHENDQHQRSLRGRVNESITELKESLHELPKIHISPPQRTKSLALYGSIRHISPNQAKDELTKAVHPRTLIWHGLENHPPKYKYAVQQLKQMLQDKEVPETADVKPTGPLPTPEEAAQLLQSQSGYTQQLECENRYVKEELAVLIMKLTKILEENKVLHQELKTTVVHEIIREGGDINKFTGVLDVREDVMIPRMTRVDYKRWQIELERLSSLHIVKTERLETQLLHTRSEVHKLEQCVEDLKSQLRMHDTLPTHENGMITDVFVSESQRSMHQQIIDRITKERDDLTDHLFSLKGSLLDMTRREEEAYQQMKKGIELVEQAQLEQTKALVEKEQLADELSNMRERFEAHVVDTHHKLESERDSARRDCKAIIEDLNNKLKDVTECFTDIQLDIEQAERQKTSLSNELDKVKAQLRKCDKEATLMGELYRSETTSTTIHHSTAVQDAARLRSQVDNLHKQKDGDKNKMKTEIDGLRRRLNSAERELVNSKEECIQLTTKAQALERELHLTKLLKHSVEQSRSEDLKSITKQSQQRHTQLNGIIADMEDKHSHIQAEMDTMLNKQNKLILKLRDECREQAVHLEKFTKSHRSEVDHLSKNNEEMKMRLERSLARLATLDDQSDQHGRVHEKMAEQLKIMDGHAQHQSQQIVEVLAKQSRLMRDRQLLARELEYVWSQIRLDKSNTVKFTASSRTLVEEILNAISTEEKLNRGLIINPEYVTHSDMVDIDELM